MWGQFFTWKIRRKIFDVECQSAIDFTILNKVSFIFIKVNINRFIIDEVLPDFSINDLFNHGMKKSRHSEKKKLNFTITA